MSMKQFITGLVASSIFLVSAYAVVVAPSNNVDNFGATNNIVQLDTATII